MKNTDLQLTKKSLAIIREKKSLLIFPLCSMIINLCALWIALIPLLKIDVAAWETGRVPGHTFIIFFCILLLLFAFTNLISLFFASALTHCALKHIQHQPYTIGSGFKIALMSIGKLYYWKLIMTSVGPAVRFSESFITRWPQTHFAINILRNLKWITATTFIIPILMTEKITPFRAIKRSAELISAKWGTKSFVRLGGGIIVFGIRVASLLPMLIAVLIGGKIIVVIGSIISAILFFSISAINTAAIIITVCALYLYACSD